MHPILRLAAPLAALALAACGKPQATDDAPLAFAPADTPYAYANLEPVPAAVTEQIARPMTTYWPKLMALYETALSDARPAMDERTRRIVEALFDEVKTHGDWDKLRAIGLKPDARLAVYGIGFVPVVRLELGDPAAFRAEIARIEQRAGAKLPLARTGDLEYWQVGSDNLAAAIAIEGNHLVVTALPPKAGDALRRALLGLTRPARNLAEAGTLQELAKKNGFSPYGAGFVDFVRMVERVSKPLAGTDAEFAQALGLPAHATDAVCAREYLAIAQRAPRLTIGAEEFTGQRIRVRTELELEPALAAEFAAAIGAAPGSGDAQPGAFDLAVATPLLKLKDFWLAQTAAIAAKPYQCADLHGLNESAAAAAARIDVTVPPPFSDLRGARLSVDRFEAGKATGSPPVVSSRLLIATENPVAALAMAQLALPALQKLKVAADGKPVELPVEALPPGTPRIAIAMSDKAIALATGDGEAATLGDYLKAPPAAAAMFVRVHFSGALYGWMARTFDTLQAAMPADKSAAFGQQKELFALYERWIRAVDFSLTAAPTGIVMQQSIEMNTAQVAP
jgi:hypothetical protein